VGRIALLTLKGRNEEKVKFSADYGFGAITETLLPVKGHVHTSPGVSLMVRSLLKSPVPRLQRRIQPGYVAPGSSSLIQPLSWVMRRTRHGIVASD
jgi:hypothetical protein